jgi:hypothetical protein
MPKVVYVDSVTGEHRRTKSYHDQKPDPKLREIEVPKDRPDNSDDYVWENGAWVFEQDRQDDRELNERVNAINVLKILLKALKDKGVLSASDFTGDEKEAIIRLLNT